MVCPSCCASHAGPFEWAASTGSPAIRLHLRPSPSPSGNGNLRDATLVVEGVSETDPDPQQGGVQVTLQATEAFTGLVATHTLAVHVRGRLDRRCRAHATVC